jgi:hypothetical protein
MWILDTVTQLQHTKEVEKVPSMLNVVHDLHPPRRRQVILHVRQRTAQRVLQPIAPCPSTMNARQKQDEDVQQSSEKIAFLG